MIANIGALYRRETEGVIVPIEAVFSAEEEPLDAEDKYVWLVNPDSMRAMRKAVRVGQLRGSDITVLEGLSEGDLIISAGVNAVQENMLVRPMEREGGL